MIELAEQIKMVEPGALLPTSMFRAAFINWVVDCNSYFFD